MPTWLTDPWPWYVAGPLMGLAVPVLLLLCGRTFGISTSLKHVCAATLPGRIEYFAYDWRSEGGWNLLFALGVLTRRANAWGSLLGALAGATVMGLLPLYSQINGYLYAGTHNRIEGFEIWKLEGPDDERRAQFAVDADPVGPRLRQPEEEAPVLGRACRERATSRP